MKLRNTPEAYGAVAVTLHWLIALAVLTMLGVGFYMDWLPKGDPLVYPLFQFHKSLGLSILVLVVLRLLWRISNPTPALPAHMPRWERFAASAAHYGFYAALLLLPLSGWVMVSASPYNIPTLYFGLFEWPHLGFVTQSPDKALYEDIAHEVHEILVWAALALIGLHAAAALRHHYMLKDTVLTRMAPWMRRPS
jgi:cytochrome b561